MAIPENRQTSNTAWIQQVLSMHLFVYIGNNNLKEAMNFEMESGDMVGIGGRRGRGDDVIVLWLNFKKIKGSLGLSYSVCLVGLYNQTDEWLPQGFTVCKRLRSVSWLAGLSWACGGCLRCLRLFFSLGCVCGNILFSEKDASHRVRSHPGEFVLAPSLFLKIQ